MTPIESKLSTSRSASVVAETLAGAVAVIVANARSVGRSWFTELGPSLIQPLLIVGVFGGVLARTATRVHDPGSATSWSYTAYVAIGVVTASAAISGAVDTSHLVFVGQKLTDRFTTIVSTPVSPVSLAFGQIGWAAAQAGAISLVLGALFSPLLSAGALLRLPIAVTITALAAAALGSVLTLLVAYGTSSPQVLNVISRVIVPPIFLFSGTVFPLSALPGWAAGTLSWLPVAGGCTAVRSAYAGQWDEMVRPVAVLLVWTIVAGTWLAHRMSRELSA